MRKIILIFLVLSYIYASSMAQGLNLSVNYPDGYRYSVESGIDLFVEQEFMGIRYNTKMEIITLMNMRVEGIDADSNFIITASYQKMNIRVSSLLINMEVSSESSLPGDSLSFALKSLIGKEFFIHQRRNGEISEIAGLDETISSAIESSTLPAEQKPEFTRNLIQSLGQNALSDNYSSFKSFYPGFRIKAPAEWNYKSNILKSGLPMELNSHVRLKSSSKNIAVMVSDGTIVKQKTENQNLQPTPEIKIFTLSGDEVSEVRMDTKTGLIVESIISQNVSGTLRTPSGESTDEEIFIPFKIISRITSKVLPVK